MMGLDAARAADPVVKINKNPGEGLVSAKKKKDPHEAHHSPVIATEDQPLNIQVPEGWNMISR